MPAPSGPVLLWPPLLAIAGPGDSSAGHRHHAMHLVLAREGTIDVAHDRKQRVAGVLTRPDVSHAIDAKGREIVLLFVEPESDPGARLLGACPDPIRAIDERERDALLDRFDPMRIAQWAPVAIDRLAGSSAPERRVHPKIRKLLKILRELPPGADTSLATLSSQVSLSEGRLMHAFTESVGIPLRPYLQWLKMQRAASAIVRGVPLSQAAVEAGFVDGAHMSRTFRRTFGLSPSMLRSQPIQARAVGGLQS